MRAETLIQEKENFEENIIVLMVLENVSTGPSAVYSVEFDFPYRVRDEVKLLSLPTSRKGVRVWI